jgi:hypothetical protein
MLTDKSFIQVSLAEKGYEERGLLFIKGYSSDGEDYGSWREGFRATAL